jgi:catechol 2,3-dioxygenase-like lactoylglutathione lyase family enzyme
MRIHHVALRSRDLGRLRAFYRDLLGLALTEERPGESVWLDAGGTILMLERATEAEPSIDPGTRELLAFAIAPGERAAFERRLAAGGVPIEASTEFTVYVRDPDGRRVGLSHYPAKADEPPELSGARTTP